MRIYYQLPVFLLYTALIVVMSGCGGSGTQAISPTTTLASVATVSPLVRQTAIRPNVPLRSNAQRKVLDYYFNVLPGSTVTQTWTDAGCTPSCPDGTTFSWNSTSVSGISAIFSPQTTASGQQTTETIYVSGSVKPGQYTLQTSVFANLPDGTSAGPSDPNNVIMEVGGATPAPTPTPGHNPTPSPIGSSWQLLSGGATEVSIGTNGSTWIIGTNPSSGGGNQVFYWNGTTWQMVDGGAVRIAVDSSGNPWIVNSAQQIFERIGGAAGSWQLLPGSATDIAAGPSGQIWITGTNLVPGTTNYQLFRWSGSSWVLSQYSGVRLAIDGSSNVWYVQADGSIHNSANGTAYPGSATAIAAEGNAVWILGTNPVTPGNYQVFYWTGSSWLLIDGYGNTIAVSGNGLPWVTNTGGQILQRH